MILHFRKDKLKLRVRLHVTEMKSHHGMKNLCLEVSFIRDETSRIASRDEI